MKKFDLKKAILENKATFHSSLTEGEKEYYKDAEADDAEHIDALEKDMEDDKKSSKMKKSELKELIKSSIMKEMYLDVDNMEDAPESEVDFLAEVDAILAEADEEVAVDDTEVAVDGEENIDVDTTTEVDPNVKAVQDALTQAQAAAQKLGDPKLTDQIGNTITFFTRAHVVDKGAVAEGEESLNEDLTSALTALIISIIAIPAIPITGALIMGLIDYLFNDLPDQRAEAKSLRLYKGPDKQEKVLALAKEIESKLSPGKKKYLKTLVNRIGAAKLEDKAKEYRELDRYAQSQKLDENLTTDIEAALKDLPIPSNEMEEGKKEYYKDAEADDAEHIKALEKDMEDDKKSSLKETLLLQKRAGILTESQYKEKMKEAEESVSQDTIQKAEKEAEKIANSSKFDAEMEKIWAKMSDEDKKNLQQGLKSAGILSESLSEGISFDTVLDKTQDIAATLEEADGDTAAKIGKIVGMVGKFNAMSFGIPGALVALAAGAPALTAIGVTGAGLLAGAALWWLGNKLSGGAVDRAF